MLHLYGLFYSILLYCILLAVFKVLRESFSVFVQLFCICASVVLQLCSGGVCGYVSDRSAGILCRGYELVQSSTDVFLEYLFFLTALYLFLLGEVQNKAFLLADCRVDLIQQQDNNHREMEYHGDI